MEPQISEAASSRKAPKQFRQAAILAWVVQELYQPPYAVSRYRAGKMIYLIERAIQLGLFQSYLKKAAGPYDPSLKYRGPENIAVNQRQWLTEIRKSHFQPGPNMEEVLGYVSRYINVEQARSVIERFRRYQDPTLSRWTTVDMAAQELKAEGKAVTAAAVLRYIDTIPEWRDKLDRLEFAPSFVEGTLQGLRSLGYLNDETNAL